jgi:putative ABC transport system substrate-binding protein
MACPPALTVTCSTVTFLLPLAAVTVQSLQQDCTRTGYLAMARRSAWHVDKILKGIAPGVLAAELGTAYSLFVNLKTAKELGITISPAVLARADEVVE